MRFRQHFPHLFGAYASAGAFVAVVIYLTSIFALANHAESSFSSSTLPAIGYLTTMLFILWPLALIPAGVASLLLCVAFSLWPPIYETRWLRMVVAAGLGVGASALFVLLLEDRFDLPQSVSQVLVLSGGCAAAALASLSPSFLAPTPSNKSLERSRDR